MNKAIDALKALLTKENLELVDTTTRVPLDGIRRLETLNNISTTLSDFWDDDITLEIDKHRLAHLVAASTVDDE
jgi:hypothetical protein